MALSIVTYLFSSFEVVHFTDAHQLDDCCEDVRYFTRHVSRLPESNLVHQLPYSSVYTLHSHLARFNFLLFTVLLTN